MMGLLTTPLKDDPQAIIVKQKRWNHKNTKASLNNLLLNYFNILFISKSNHHTHTKNDQCITSAFSAFLGIFKKIRLNRD